MKKISTMFITVICMCLGLLSAPVFACDGASTTVQDIAFPTIINQSAEVFDKEVKTITAMATMPTDKDSGGNIPLCMAACSNPVDMPDAQASHYLGGDVLVYGYIRAGSSDWRTLKPDRTTAV